VKVFSFHGCQWTAVSTLATLAADTTLTFQEDGAPRTASNKFQERSPAAEEEISGQTEATTSMWRGRPCEPAERMAGGKNSNRKTNRNLTIEKRATRIFLASDVDS
jgi:hypothetical protein